MYQFKAKDLDIKPYPLCLGNRSKDFTLHNIKNTIKGILKFFPVDYDHNNASNIWDNHRFVIKER